MIGGKAIIVVGGTGMGKTTFNKRCLSQVSKDVLYIYDVNNEYREFMNENYVLPSFKSFCEKAGRLSQSVIVFEEATIFLSNKGSNQLLIDILVRKRHTNNLIFLVFHSLRAVPKYLLDLCNMLVLHKTNDPDTKVKELDNDELLNAYYEIKKAPMLQNDTGRLYSPNKIIKLL